MKSITSSWFECQVRCDKIQEDGSKKLETVNFVVDALTFTEAESTITSQMEGYTDFQIKNITPAAYKEVVFSEKDADDRWFNVKVTFTTTDEKGKTKHSRQAFLVQADKASTADRYIAEILGNTMTDWRVTANKETKILDVFEH